jgi:hypothetical protein
MNDESPNGQLRAFAVPAPSEAARSRARHRALLAFREKGSLAKEATTGSLFWRHPWAGLVATVIVVIAVTIWLRPRGSTENLASDRKMLEEVEQLFPHQLNAIVQKGDQTDLSVTQVNEVGGDQPVLLVFKRGNEIVRVLSFSGHRVCVPLGTDERCFEILETADGGVILEGKDDVLLASRHPMVAGYALQARTLPL